MHVVMLDNGRSRLLGTRYQEALHCIRCGACQNVCPVYRQVGGHAYGWVYGGPIGAVLTPLFRGQGVGGELPHASSLCGSCDDICPVKIPLHHLLLNLRHDRTAAGEVPRHERIAATLWSYAWSSPLGYRLSARFGRLGVGLVGRRRTAPAWTGPLARWTMGRALPAPARRPWHRRVR
jgi:L-lactate dehydrogenase complex protein LldF